MDGHTRMNIACLVTLLLLSLCISVWIGGTTSARAESPDDTVPSLGKVDLNAVSGVNATTAWAVGPSGTVLGFDGLAWSRRPSGTSSSLNDVAAPDVGDAWAVGEGGEILHYDGSSWAPQEKFTEENLVSVTATDSTHVWTASNVGSIHFYDGSCWSLQASGIFSTLNDIEALAPDDVWATGLDGTLAHFDGIFWAGSASLPDEPLRELSGCDPHHLWGLDVNGEITYRDGASWSERYGAQPVVDIHVIAPGFVWAVCESGDILAYDGITWEVQHETGEDGLRSVFGLNTENAWAAGGEEILLSFGMRECRSQGVHTLWYFGEGSTAHGFEEYLLVANPNPDPVDISVSYFTGDESYSRGALEIDGYSRMTIDVSQDMPDSDVASLVFASDEVICERAMYWGEREDGHCALGQTYAGRDWYLAEGATGWGFEEWICLFNPSGTTATVDIDYMTESGKVERDGLLLKPWSRETVDVRADIGEASVSARISSDVPVVAERSMYWNDRRGGHCSEGTTAPRKQWFLAEGSTMYGFSEWILVVNPNEQEATVEVDFLTPAGLQPRISFRVEPESRFTIDVSQHFWGDHSTALFSDIPVVVERSMYWDNGSGWAGHNAPALPSPRNTWYLAEGCTSYGFQEYVTIANPFGVDVEVGVYYLASDGPSPGGTLRLAPYSRLNLDVNGGLPDENVSVNLSADVPVVAERPMYWHHKGGGHCAPGFGP